VDVEQLRLLVRSALRESPQAEIEGASTEGGGHRSTATRLIGQTPAMQQLRLMIERVGRSMAPVAIMGESGSGKELVARAIHEQSARRHGPFIAVNCGAIPENLMEAEFFGYRKGAFTGADQARDGFFQAAAGGTLFLDEVAELPLPMQVKLLRALQERRVRKVGATQEEPVDVRLLSATHQDLPKLVSVGRFRQDLFYRLNVIELRVPSLRARAADIPLIARALLARMVAQGGPQATLSEAACAALQSYTFPGNVRELENILERAVALAGEAELEPEDLLLNSEASATTLSDVDEGASSTASQVGEATHEDERADAQQVLEAQAFELQGGVPTNLSAYLDALERDAIRAALSRTHQNRTAAAQLLGITFRQLRYRMQRLGLK